MELDNRIVKVSICQVCNGWIRAAALYYFNENVKARNEFMREVAKYNLAVKEIPMYEWLTIKIQQCNCKNN